MVNLTKGQAIDLRKDDGSSLKKVIIGLGWDMNKGGIFSRGSNIDVDASIICMAGKQVDKIVFYGNLHEYGNAIVHMGDNLTGEGDGDDEVIKVDLTKVPERITMLRIIINIYDCKSRRQDFSRIKNCFVHVDDGESKEKLCEYIVSDGKSASQEFADKTGIFVANIYRYNGDWKFKAVGQGVNVSSIMDMQRMA